MSEGRNRVRGSAPCRANVRAVRPRASPRDVEDIVVNNQDALERILALLYDAMLDETRWPATSALINEACGLRARVGIALHSVFRPCRAVCGLPVSPPGSQGCRMLSSASRPCGSAWALMGLAILR